MSIYLKALPFVVIICVVSALCGWLYYQSNKIDGLNAQVEKQVQTIELLQKANQQLVENLEQEQQAVEKSQKIANELRNKVEIAQNEIKSILAQGSCAKTDLPNGAADSIKRLHQQNNHKH